MSNDLEKTIRFQRKNAPGSQRSGGVDPDATTEFELVSTRMLERILHDKDDLPRRQIEELADDGDGWLVRETDGKSFDIVKDDELKAALRAANEIFDPLGMPDASLDSVDSLKETVDDLCLVSTQHLRVFLKADSPEGDEEVNAIEAALRSFDPYDKG